MNRHHSILATVTALACAATLTLSGCGGGGSSSSTGAFCNTLKSVAGTNVQGQDPASLAKAADAFRKLGGRAGIHQA